MWAGGPDGEVEGHPVDAEEHPDDPAAVGADDEGTRDRLLRVAATLLEKRGRAAVTLRAVGAGAGVSRSAPYRYFDSKDGLLAAVAARALRLLSEELAMALAGVSGTDPAAQLDAMGRAYLGFACANPEQYALIYSREVAEVDDPDLTAAAAAASVLFVGVTARATDAGLLPPGDPRHFAAVLLAAAHGAADLAGAGHLQADKWGIETGDIVRLLLSMVNRGS